jgi:hypothetical protein
LSSRFLANLSIVVCSFAFALFNLSVSFAIFAYEMYGWANKGQDMDFDKSAGILKERAHDGKTKNGF